MTEYSCLSCTNSKCTPPAYFSIQPNWRYASMCKKWDACV